MISLKNHLLITLGLSALLGMVLKLFYINSFIPIPQFTHFDEFQEVIKIIESKDKWGYYISFFAIDFFWAFSLLSLAVRYIDNGYNNNLLLANPRNLSKSFVLKVSAALAYGADVIENVSYLTVALSSHLEAIAQVKIILYIVTALIFLYHLFEQKIFEKRKVIGRFLSISYLSLFLLLIIVGIMTVLPQGSTIIVDLFFRPVDLFFTFILMGMLALILSHYPSYFNARIEDKTQTICWHIEKPILGFGIVHFSEMTQSNYEHKDLIRYLRHQLGTLIFIAFIYLMLFVAKKYFDPRIDTSYALFIFVGALYLYGLFRRRGTLFSVALFNTSYKVSIGLVIGSSILSGFLGWCILTWTFVFLSIISLMITYLLFTLVRQNINVNFLSNHLQFIRFIAVFGWITLVALVLLNLYPTTIATNVSPLVILMLYLINLYGLIVIVFKHYLFYSDEDDKECPENPIKSRLFRIKYIIPIVTLALVIWIGYAGKISNDLHELQPGTTGCDTLITVPEFAEALPDTTLNGTKFKSYYEIASYGGGLKAALWNLLVLNKLQAESAGEFLRSTVAISANSGGTSGTGMYGPLWTFDSSAIANRPDSLWPRIIRIGQFNHLSIDLTYLLGRDLVREIFPLLSYHGKDRSYVAAKCYAELMKMPRCYEQLTFRHLWTKMYRKNGYYPSFISQTISTDGVQGNAFSLLVEGEYSEVFPGARSILDHPVCSGEITYFGALSTSNRFPIFSPAAKIKGKGYFLDGGYFDNSGISSISSLHNHLVNKDLYQDSTRVPRIVVINNSKGDYIKSIIKKWLKMCKDETSTNELSAMIQTLVSLDKVPNYFEDKIKGIYGAENIYSIHLPVKISYEDIVGVLKGEPKELFPLMERVEENNARIDSVLMEGKGIYKQKWGYVEPPLARLNSIPAVFYQQVMIDHHPHIQDEIKKIMQDLK